MSLRDECLAVFHSVGRVPGDFALLWNWIEQKLTEAQAETKRIIICVWCGQTIERTGDIKVDVKASQAHDASCEKNPVRRQAQAEMVERVLQVCNTDRGDSTWGGLLKAIRALSPDPHARERWELEARREVWKLVKILVNRESFLSVDSKAEAEIADLERQLAALPKGARQ